LWIAIPGELSENRAQVYMSFMSKAEQYRRLAEEATKRAEDARDSKAKGMYEQLARSWRDLANQCERQAQPPSHADKS
jgi:hypothetical protein